MQSNAAILDRYHPRAGALVGPWVRNGGSADHLHDGAPRGRAGNRLLGIAIMTGASAAFWVAAAMVII